MMGLMLKLTRAVLRSFTLPGAGSSGRSSGRGRVARLWDVNDFFLFSALLFVIWQ